LCDLQLQRRPQHPSSVEQAVRSSLSHDHTQHTIPGLSQGPRRASPGGDHARPRHARGSLTGILLQQHPSSSSPCSISPPWQWRTRSRIGSGSWPWSRQGRQQQRSRPRQQGQPCLNLLALLLQPLDWDHQHVPRSNSKRGGGGECSINTAFHNRRLSSLHLARPWPALPSRYHWHPSRLRH
jgi:hypothetical protein